MGPHWPPGAVGPGKNSQVAHPVNGPAFTPFKPHMHPPPLTGLVVRPIDCRRDFILLL